MMASQKRWVASLIGAVLVPMLAGAQAPAQANYRAWFDARFIPTYSTPKYPHLAWQEIGPRVLYEGDLHTADSGRMTAVAIDPSDTKVIYACSASGGIWKTTDRCRTWAPISDYEPSLSFGAIAIDPFHRQTIYAGMGEPNNSLDSFIGAGMVRSEDGGKHWKLLGRDVFLGSSFTSIIPNPKIPGFLYASTNHGMYRSLNAGADWVQLFKGDVTALVIDPHDPNRLIAAIGLFRGSPDNGLYESEDSGQSWHKLTKDLPFDGKSTGRISMDQCRDFPQVIYASFYGNNAHLDGFMRSDDFGKTWIQMENTPQYAGGQSWYDNVVAVCPSDPNAVFVSGTSTYRSLDGGRTWIDDTRSYAGGFVHPDHHAIVFDPVDTKRLYLCTDGGIFKSDDLGDTWASVSAGLGTIQFQQVATHPTDSKIAYGGTQDNGTNKFTGSLAWDMVFGGDGGYTAVDQTNPNIVYGQYVDLALYKSVDAGANWQWGTTKGINRKEGALFYAPFVLDPNNQQVVIAGGKRLWRSTDGEENWTSMSPPFDGLVSAIAIAPNQSTVVYAGTTVGKLWVTPDGGKTWYDESKGLPKGYIGSIGVSPTNARVVYATIVGWTGPAVWRSDNAGGTWKNVSGNLPIVPSRCILVNPHNPDQVFLGTDIGVFVSDTKGGYWQKFGFGLPTVPVFSITCSPANGLLTIGTHGRGAWRIPLPN